MIRRLITRLLAVRHPWRYIGFDELSELYTSTMLRSMGISVVGIFVPIYLYKLGYDIVVICLFMTGVCVARVIFDVLAGYIIARIGPKHTILLSNLTQIVALALILMLSQLRIDLWLIALLWGASLSLFFIAYHVDFSKIMHKDHGGKELGYMTMLERIGAALGPVAGGVIATMFGAEWTITAAILLFMGATLPLFLTSEPTQLHQRIHFRGLPIRRLRRDMASYFAIGVDNSLSVSMWPFFAALTILTVNTYASVGFVTSLGIIAAILSARLIGRTVDRDKGRTLLNWSVVVNAVVHVFRPFTTGFGGVLTVNIANEVVTSGFRLPYFKGMYARADDLPGYRIIYISVMEVMLDLGRGAVWLAVAGLSLLMAPTGAMAVIFVVGGALTLLTAAQNFPALRPSRFLGP